MAIDAITNAGLINQVDTEKFFNVKYNEGALSPIDNFIKNTNDLNLIFAKSKPDSVTANLLLLGYVSAVESFIRAVARRVINIDEVAQKNVESKEVTYGAAIHHDDLLMPEALLQNRSLAGISGITYVVKDLLSIKGGFSPDLDTPLNEYRKICQLRHCVVHRFGKLGINNAIYLGLERHKEILEKPLYLDDKALNEIADILRCFVKSLNNFIFYSLLDRSAKNKNDQGSKLYKVDWYWNFNRDRKRFKSYYDIFSSSLDSVPSIDIKTLYYEFRDEYK